MKKLLQIELIKTLNNSTFRVILILHFSLFLLLIYVSTKIEFSVPGFSTQNMFMFPNVWTIFSWFASWFNLLFLGIIIIVLTGNEFSYKTSRMQIMNGLSRENFLFGKGFIILLIAFWGMLLVLLASSVTGIIFTSEISFQKVLDKSYLLLVYFIQAIGYMCFALMVVSIFRNNALSIMMYLLYFIMIEPIFRWFFPKVIRPYFPVKILSGLTPVPEFISITSDSTFVTFSGKSQLDFESIGILPQSIPLLSSLILTIVYIFLFILVIFTIIRKSDL